MPSLVYTYGMEKSTKKMGRPPKDPAEVRDRRLVIRLSEAEEAALSRPDVSTWAREVLLRAAKRRA